MLAIKQICSNGTVINYMCEKNRLRIKIKNSKQVATPALFIGFCLVLILEFCENYCLFLCATLS